MKIMRFTADWCQPCKVVARLLTEVKTPAPIEVIDIDDKSELAMKFKIRSVPTIMMVSSADEEISRITGTISKEKLESWLLQYESGT